MRCVRVIWQGSERHPRLLRHSSSLSRCPMASAGQANLCGPGKPLPSANGAGPTLSSRGMQGTSDHGFATGCETDRRFRGGQDGALAKDRLGPRGRKPNHAPPSWLRPARGLALERGQVRRRSPAKRVGKWHDGPVGCECAAEDGGCRLAGTDSSYAASRQAATWQAGMRRCDRPGNMRA